MALAVVLEADVTLQTIQADRLCPSFFQNTSLFFLRWRTGIVKMLQICVDIFVHIFSMIAPKDSGLRY